MGRANSKKRSIYEQNEGDENMKLKKDTIIFYFIILLSIFVAIIANANTPKTEAIDNNIFFKCVDVVKCTIYTHIPAVM